MFFRQREQFFAGFFNRNGITPSNLGLGTQTKVA